MDVLQLGMKTGVIFAAILLVWMIFKVLSFIWKVFVIITVVLFLSIALPAVREWVLRLF